MIEKTRKNRRGIQVSTATASLAAALATAQREKARADKAEAELAKRIEFWECPKCAFRMGTEHSHVDGSYSCPNCAEQALRTEVAKLRKVAEAAKQVSRCLAEFTTSAELGNAAYCGEYFDALDAALADAGKGAE